MTNNRQDSLQDAKQETTPARRRVRPGYIGILCLVLMLGGMASAYGKPMYTDNKSPALTSVNINTASAKEIAAALTGVGKKKAEKIVMYRDQHGPFEAVEALIKVKGIGKKILARNLDRVVLE